MVAYDKTTADFFRAFQKDVWQTAEDHGFHTGTTVLDFAAKIALIHSEVSEALEALRRPEHAEYADSAVGEELADVVIRTFDLAESMGIDLADALLAKAAFNRGRPFKHGKKF